MLLGRVLRRFPPAPPGHRSGRRGVVALGQLLG
jgi:hypothetical protein